MNKQIELLLNHQSIRKYADKEVTQETINTIIEVKDKEKRKLLSESAGGQKWVVSAPLVLLFCGDLYRGSKYYENIDQDILSNTEQYTIATVDAALAGQKALIAAQTLGLGGVVVGGIRNEVELVSKEFKLPNLVFPIFLLCLGYPADDPGLKPRLPQGVIHKIDTYDETKDAILIGEYNKTVSAYYEERTNGETKDRWTERCGKYLMAKPRYNVGEYFRKIGLLKR